MYPSKQTNNGWILCPSKRFPDKFYYFNVATGETAWCLKETERKLLKNSPLQTVDHCYPEPCSPPTEETPTISNHKQSLKFTPYQEGLSNYPQEISNYPVKILNNYAVPFNQISPSPYQIQLPMIWQSDGNMPQVVMIVMNQAMRQLAIEDPKQVFRHPNPAPHLNRAWIPNQPPNEQIQPWREPCHPYKDPNQPWKEANPGWKEKNQAPKQLKEPERELFIHSGKLPLCERFINFKKPILELKDDNIHPNQLDLSAKPQYDLTTNKSNGPTYSQTQIINSPGPSKLSQNNPNPQEKLFHEPQFNHTMNSPKSLRSKSSELMLSHTSSAFSPKNFSNPKQNLLMSTEELFGKSQTNHTFGQSHNRQPYRQSQTKQLLEQNQTRQLFGKNQTNEDLVHSQKKHEGFDHIQGSQEVFGLSHSLFRQNPTKQELFGQSNKNAFFSQFQPKQQLSKPSQTCPENFKPHFAFQKPTTEKSTPMQTEKDLPESPNLKVPTSVKENGTNDKQKSILTFENKAVISQGQNLDKNDLRRVLIEKKRKSNILETTDTIEAKKNKSSMQNKRVCAPKKKVTFNLDPQTFSGSDSGDNCNGAEWQAEMSSPLSVVWYVVSDAETLLVDFDSLDNFVSSDPNCKLMIPYRVMSDIAAVASGECRDTRERSRVTLARYLLRGLATPQPHIVVQQSEDISLDISTDDSIINCCLEVANGSYVVLITSDSYLQMTAECLNITWFTADHIKNGEAMRPKVHFDTAPNKNEQNNSEIPTEKFENFTFGTEKSNISSPKSSRNTENVFHSKTAKTSGSELNYTAKMKSIFERANHKHFSKNGSIFEVNGVEKFVNENEPRNSIFKSKPIKQTLTVFEAEKCENTKAHSQPFVFGKENIANKEGQLSSSASVMETYKSRENQKGSSIFDGKLSSNQTKPNGMDPKENQSKAFQKDANVSKNRYLELFLKSFYDENKGKENIIEDRKSEIDCTFKQIMEECFNNILQNKISLWTYSEGLECVAIEYKTHTYIRDLVCVLRGFLNAKGDLPARDVIRNLGCGVALVKYLKFLSPTSEVLRDTEDALNAILRNLTEVTDIEPKISVYRSTEVECVERNSRNFVKDRSDVVKYLKNHFSGWADYDETLEETTSTREKNCKNTMVLRTYGKHLGMLKLNNSKKMTMEPDSSQNVDENTQTTKNGPGQEIDANYKGTENVDDENMIFCENFAKDLKLTRTVQNTAAKVLEAFDGQKLMTKNVAKENKITEPKRTEPKIVRLCGEIDFTKENKKAPEKPDFGDFFTHGHTFGTTERNGPKILRNIKPIKEFDEKFKIERKNLNLDDTDYSVVSKSDENNNMASENTNNNCQSMSLDMNDNSGVKTYLNVTNDAQNLDSNHNSTATNNDSRSMSIEKCITNNTYGAMDLDEILPINDMYYVENHVDFDPNFTDVNYGTNDNYNIDAMNDDNRLNYANDNVINDNVINDLLKDDTTIDSGYDTASQQAYHLIDSFFYELKVVFKAMHEFIGNSVRELRSGVRSASTRRVLRDTAATFRGRLTKIMENLDCIIHRENSTGPLVKELVAGAGSVAANDERICNYREIVTKCYNHARLIDNTLRLTLSIENGRRL